MQVLRDSRSPGCAACNLSACKPRKCPQAFPQVLRKGHFKTKAIPHSSFFSSSSYRDIVELVTAMPLPGCGFLHCTTLLRQFARPASVEYQEFRDAWSQQMSKDARKLFLKRSRWNRMLAAHKFAEEFSDDSSRSSGSSSRSSRAD